MFRTPSPCRPRPPPPPSEPPARLSGPSPRRPAAPPAGLGPLRPRPTATSVCSALVVVLAPPSSSLNSRPPTSAATATDPYPLPTLLSAAGAAIKWESAWANLQAASNLSNTKPSATGPVGTYRNCGSSSDLAQNLVISIEPDSPTAGQDVTTKFSYDLISEVTGGEASYGFSFNGIPFSPTIDDLCADQAGGCCPDPCPLQVGHHDNESHSEFPSGVSGKVITTIKWSDQDGNQILCVEWTVKS